LFEIYLYLTTIRYINALVLLSQQGQQPCFGAHSASYLMDSRAFLIEGVVRGCVGEGTKLNNHLNLVLRLRINGAMPLLPLFAATVKAGRALC
jgi:hypothetical protein